MADQTTPPAVPPGGDKKPMWTRWWMILIYVILGLGALSSLSGDNDAGSEEAGAEGTTTTASVTTISTQSEPTTTAAPSTTTTRPPTTTTTLPPTTTSTQPTTTTTLAPVEGSGDDFFEFAVPGDEAAVLEIAHDGDSNFAVVTYDEENERIDLLVNEIGSYRGRLPVNFLIGEEVAFVEITASGSWRIQTIMLSDLDVNVGNAAGTGDDVVVMDVSSPTMDITHTGESNFAVRAWTDSRDLLVNEIGPYQGTVRSPTGIVVFEITADGDWTLAEG